MKLYAIRYGENYKYATYGTIFKGAQNTNDLVPGFTFLYYVAIYNGRVIVFDTGFRNKREAFNMGITLYDTRRDLENIGLHSYDVNTIFITHSHFDHINNLDLYQSQSIIISDQEYEYALENSPDAVKKKLQSSTVVLVEKEYIYEDKFIFKVIGGHTKGSSVIYFHEGEKKYLITGDECYMCDNILQNIPTGIVASSTKNEQFILDANENGWIPLPFHDAKILSHYKRISENIVQVI